jgi:hypothetical protein
LPRNAPRPRGFVEERGHNARRGRRLARLRRRCLDAPSAHLESGREAPRASRDAHKRRQANLVRLYQRPSGFLRGTCQARLCEPARRSLRAPGDPVVGRGIRCRHSPDGASEVGT